MFKVYYYDGILNMSSIIMDLDGHGNNFNKFTS